MAQYLGEIFRLQEYQRPVGLSSLAEHMNVSLQAASRMLNRLQRAALIDHQPYRGVELTQAGERIALQELRRHRISEVFLVRVMGFGWDEVHDLTDQFESGISDLMLGRIEEMAGFPTRCPHGEPIPARDGTMPVLQDSSLTSLKPGAEGRISRVRVNEPARLRYLAELDLIPGATIQLVSQSPFNGPVRVKIGQSEQILGHDLASALWIDIERPNNAAP